MRFGYVLGTYSSDDNVALAVEHWANLMIMIECTSSTPPSEFSEEAVTLATRKKRHPTTAPYIVADCLSLVLSEFLPKETGRSRLLGLYP